MTQHTHDETRHETRHDSDGGRHEMKMYLRFGLMIATSTVVMFALTYTNAFSVDHVRFSEERVYMALLMAAAMALIMLAFMWGMMYRNRAANVGIVVGALLLGATALYLSRSQALVDDESYMKAMIPHHSIAILTSERAGIEDVRVRELADGITAAQRKEIKEMDWLVRDIEENGPVTTPEEAEKRPVPDFEGTAMDATDTSGVGDTLLRALFALPFLGS
ncbi:hypothetical protein GCM10011376_15310 [Nocardioides flavus (ex Wang et al. 2016)]|uniref:DUF305 domain-containing protein n=1 Tax=Nocardioides flavus (ex Wang et al. 2016) TaxID=2058780 RepID=A0ABQ3HJP5_9ACTN|nr:DUF305 domain-containing protein [Nocardioides flavus (ex Wang et al. 2016)]GHE16921.1 hypothetical protein GCM10011376_15310 [Nocardioides flavus (ex Wang et al. 2016)]